MARVGDWLVPDWDGGRAGLIIVVPNADGSPPYVVKWQAGGHIALVRGDLCQTRVTVRNRRPGDRFHPVGVSGGKKLQDYFARNQVFPFRSKGGSCDQVSGIQA